jgi:hypothetical protein
VETLGTFISLHPRMTTTPTIYLHKKWMKNVLQIKPMYLTIGIHHTLKMDQHGLCMRDYSPTNISLCQVFIGMSMANPLKALWNHVSQFLSRVDFYFFCGKWFWIILNNIECPYISFILAQPCLLKLVVF